TVQGTTAVVGEPQGSFGGKTSGTVVVFTRTGPTWNAQPPLGPASGADYDNFGSSVSLDGLSLAIGAMSDDEAASDAGATYVFWWGGSWSVQQKLLAPGAVANERMGRSVSISGDLLVAGSYTASGALGATGEARGWTRSGTTWTDRGELVPADLAPGWQHGHGVA